jgi:tRNA wybutosine-synthesizing protein 2
LQERLAQLHVPAEFAPTKWERIGDVLVIRLRDAARPYADRIARALGEVLACRTVVEDASGIHGVLRTPDIRPLWGDGTETVHLEGGVRYKLDVAKVMFASGNVAERIAIASKVRDGSVVVDLFAGIGYFALPIAVHARPAAVYACELNPVAFVYLQENVRLNRATAVVPLLGDCRETAPEGAADVVLMGHFSATEYLDVAFRTLGEQGLVVFHTLCPREQYPESPIRRFTEAGREHWYDVESAHARIVKSYAPGIVHAVLEARVRRRPRGRTARP